MTAPGCNAHPHSLTEAGQVLPSEAPTTHRRRAKWLPNIDTTRCTGWRKASTLIDAAACTGCQKCAVKCPFRVIAMVPQPA